MKQKNKNIQYFLIALVVVIWGAIAVQFFNYQGGELTAYNGLHNNLPIARADAGEVFEFDLNLNYDDPFLTTKRKGSTSSSNIKSTKVSKQRISKYVQKKINPQKKEKYPQVIYKGYSLNNNQITRVNLSINQKTVSMKVGASKDGLLLKETYRDSLLVSFKGKEKMIFRKK